MSLIVKSKIIGSHVLFVPEGLVIAGVVPEGGGAAVGGGTVSQSYLPALPDAAPWTPFESLGGVRDFTATPKSEVQDIVLPSPGRYQRTDEIVTSTTLDLAFSLVGVSPLFFETLFLGKAAAETGIYNIGSGTGKIRGWLRVAQYDQADTELNHFHVYVSAMFKAAKMENKLIVAELDCKVLYSALATGTLTFA